MPRKLRNIAQGMTHHCYSRCHNKKNLLQSRFGKKYFIEAVNMCQKKYEFELVAAEIVANHIHLIIKTLHGTETISQIMQYIKSRIGEKYNKSMNKTGPFWNERFGSTIIEESENPEQYLLWLLWYIGFNPVRKGLSNDPRNNDIGFINVYLSKNAILDIKITPHRYFLKLGQTFDDCVKKFLLYEESYRKRISLMF